MNLKANNQTQLYGLEFYFNEFINLYNKKKLPNKILLSGSKGIGKCTLAYHIINYILSKEEENPYNLAENKINLENKSFKLILNQSSPNFNLIDVSKNKKNISIDQIRNLITHLSKSSFNNKPRFVLIDNIELLNLNSINSLLKTLEEPNDNIYFILINNDKKILPTLKSRCINFNISLSNNLSNQICNKLLSSDIKHLINEELLDYYFTPGKIFNLIKFSDENSIDLKNIKLEDFISLIIDNFYYKKDNSIKYILYDFFEFFLLKKTLFKNTNLYSYFIKKIEMVKKFNLDEEALFIEFKYKVLNG